MPTSDSIAVVSVIVAGVVGVSAPAIAAVSAHYRQVRQQQHERLLKEQDLRQQERLKDIEELRNVLDGALQSARALHVSGLDVLAHLAARADGADDDHGGGAPDTLPLTDAVGLAGSRLVIRLGRGHVVTRRYNAVRDSLSELGGLLDEVSADGDAWTRQDTRAQLDAALQSSGSAIRAYVDAANATVGVADGTDRDAVDS